MSMAAAARDVLRRPATDARAANQTRSMSKSNCRSSAASSASASRKAGTQAASSNGMSAPSARGPVSGTGARSSFCPVQKRIRAARIARDTLYALTLAQAYAELYEGAKSAAGALDFGDLIAGTEALLTRRADAAWVLYKLDGGIDHILLDEAQDTAPDQWEILHALTSEFFAGAGLVLDRTAERTVFAVGDEKQSI